MSKTLTKKVRHDVEDALDDAAKALKRAAEDLGDDAEHAVGEAAEALRHATEVFMAQAKPQMQDALAAAGPQARQLATTAVKEAKEHPIATAVAALTAAAALIKILGVGRKRKAA
jgi:hypothetical protein